MSHLDSVSAWIGQLKEGEQDAAQRLWARYVDQLVRLARVKLGRTPRSVADEDDLANSAFAGYLRGIEAGRFPQMNDRDDLWQVLVVITERKAIDFRRRSLAAKRGRGVVRGDSVFAPVNASDTSPGGLSQVIDRRPAAEFAAEAAEELRCLLQILDDDVLRRIALAKMEGYTNQEIGKLLDIGLSSVERKLRMIRSMWEQEGQG